jgi:hypothetical protein
MTSNGFTHDFGVPISDIDLSLMRVDVAALVFPMVHLFGEAWTYLSGILFCCLLIQVILNMTVRAIVLYRERGCGRWIFASLWDTAFYLVRTPYTVWKKASDALMDPTLDSDDPHKLSIKGATLHQLREDLDTMAATMVGLHTNNDLTDRMQGKLELLLADRSANFTNLENTVMEFGTRLNDLSLGPLVPDLRPPHELLRTSLDILTTDQLRSTMPTVLDDIARNRIDNDHNRTSIAATLTEVAQLRAAQLEQQHHVDRFITSMTTRFNSIGLTGPTAPPPGTPPGGYRP